MAGETVKTTAICLRISPWSRSSHIVEWLTPLGIVTTAVKGAVRPKSAFLGQYDLNYTCEIIYYPGKGQGLHPLRECTPLEFRERLRGDFRAMALAEYERYLTSKLSPGGSEARSWYELLACSLDFIAARQSENAELLAEMIDFELKILDLSGISPRLEAQSGSLRLQGERAVFIAKDVAKCLENPKKEKNLKILLDTARVIGVFYVFHLGLSSAVRRSVIQMINKQKTEREV